VIARGKEKMKHRLEYPKFLRETLSKTKMKGKKGD
jgi:hypothetical protein